MDEVALQPVVIDPWLALSAKQRRYDLARLRSASVWAAQMSKDPSRKVGSILVAADGRMSSMGYNGLASGVPDTEENWSRPRKYDLVIHAEMNALDNAAFPAAGGELFSCLQPCHLCLGRLMNNRVRRIVWMAQAHPFMLNAAGIWIELAMAFTEAGGQLVEYPRDRFDDQLDLLLGHSHDGYAEGDRVCGG